MTKEVQILRYELCDSCSGAKVKKWTPIKKTTLRLFEKNSIRTVGTVEYERIDYVALSFLHDITKKNRIRIDEEDYSIEGQAIMGSINQLLLKKIEVSNGK